MKLLKPWKNWRALLVAAICGAALGAGLFAIIHRWEPGYTNYEPAGVIVDYSPIHEIIHAQIGGGGIFFGFLVVLGGAMLLSLPNGISELWVMRKAGFVLTTMGVMLVSAGSLQIRYDAIYPAAAAIDELTHACAESGKQPCMTAPQGDR